MPDPVTPEASEPGSDAYNQMMAGKYENPPEPDVNKPDALPIPPMPEGGHDKFYSADDGVYDWKSHAVEADFKVSSGKKPKELKIEDEPSDSKPPDAAAEDIITKAGLSVEDLGAQIAANGKLDDTAKAALLSQGLPESLVDEYVQLAAFRMDSQTEEAIAHAGGQDKWNELSEWAGENLNDDEKGEFNSMLSDGRAKLAIDIMTTRRAATTPMGGESALRVGDYAAEGNLGGYPSRGAMMADQQKPEYRTDSAFRAAVIAKIGASDMDAWVAAEDSGA